MQLQEASVFPYLANAIGTVVLEMSELCPD